MSGHNVGTEVRNEQRCFLDGVPQIASLGWEGNLNWDVSGTQKYERMTNFGRKRHTRRFLQGGAKLFGLHVYDGNRKSGTFEV
mmetsp:Transcript_71858/g.126597  ORF Transcript_71858/g.126597 Transcript_71858/m.126597 type:complete len:83 (+) Transcript_71858:2-250(+)